MTYIKIIFLLILAMLERCHLVERQEVPIEINIPKNKERKQQDGLYGSWKIADISGNPSEKTKTKDPLLREAGEREAVRAGVILSLFPDGTFTTIEGNGRYQEGGYKFSKADSSLSFIAGKHVEKTYLSFGRLENNARVMKLKNSLNGVERSFAEYAPPLKNHLEDPFYKNNNQWRWKPASAQTNQQIREKLANYVQHNCYILKAAGERDQEIVSWEFSEGIIKIYNGGIGVVPEAYIPESWKNVFHSPTEALQAYSLYEKFLASNKYMGAHTGNWVRDDYNILLSIYAEAKKPDLIEKNGK
jgi:hypothetical protein